MSDYQEDEYDFDDYDTYLDYLEAVGDYDGWWEELTSSYENYPRVVAIVGPKEANRVYFGRGPNLLERVSYGLHWRLKRLANWAQRRGNEDEIPF